LINQLEEWGQFIQNWAQGFGEKKRGKVSENGTKSRRCLESQAMLQLSSSSAAKSKLNGLAR
jgi:hypothetical protein